MRSVIIRVLELSKLAAVFPCPEDNVLSRPGMQNSCIFTRNFGPAKIPLFYTGEYMMMQCMGHYPIESWIIYKQLTPVPRKRSGQTVIRESSVKEEWILQLCTPKGWSKKVPIDNGEAVSI